MLLLNVKYQLREGLLGGLPQMASLAFAWKPHSQGKAFEKRWLILKFCVKVRIRCHVYFFFFNMKESVCYMSCNDSTNTSFHSGLFWTVMLFAGFWDIVFNKTKSWVSFCSFDSSEWLGLIHCALHLTFNKWITDWFLWFTQCHVVAGGGGWDFKRWFQPKRLDRVNSALNALCRSSCAGDIGLRGTGRMPLMFLLVTVTF